MAIKNVDIAVGRPPRLAVVVSHAIQHFVPQYASIATNQIFDVHVIFGSNRGVKPAHSPSFGRTVSWGDLPLDEFSHEFLQDVDSEDPALQVPRLAGYLEEIDPDLLLVYGRTKPLHVAGYKWAASRGVAMAYQADSELRQHRSPLRRRVGMERTRRFLAGVDWVMSVGDSNEHYYEKAGVSDRKIIRTGFPIDTGRYERAFAERIQLRARLRRDLGIYEEDFVVAMVGKLIARKRQQDLIDALSGLRLEGRRVVALMAGTGADEQVLRSRAEAVTEPNVINFLGFVPPTELPGVYAAADCYVHTSAVEPHSLAVSEAIYMGLPVVLSDRCGSWGPTDDVRNGENGFVYPCGRVENLRAALERIASDPQLSAAFGEGSRGIALATQERAHRSAWWVLRTQLDMA